MVGGRCVFVHGKDIQGVVIMGGDLFMFIVGFVCVAGACWIIAGAM